MAKFVPSILETNKEAFLATYAKEIKLPGVSRIQVDFGDGIFVPNKMLSVAEIDSLTPAVEWEAHLMIKAPQDFLDYQICGFNTIIIHFEAYRDVAELRAAVENIKSLGLKPAIAINGDTPVGALRDFVPLVSHFQLMGVKPGFQGTPFLENTFSRIAELRRLAPNAIIEVDGGVNAGNVRQLAQSGADFLILGSAITKVENMQEAYEKLQSLAGIT